MTLTLQGLLVLIIIAAICGAVGRALGGGARVTQSITMREQRKEIDS